MDHSRRRKTITARLFCVSGVRQGRVIKRNARLSRAAGSFGACVLKARPLHHPTPGEFPRRK